MKISIRNIVVVAFKHWRCPIHKEETNIFRVEIEPNTTPSRICEAEGTVYVSTEEFEDDVKARFSPWRSFTPGSYYFHLMLEELRSGPPLGIDSLNAKHRNRTPKNVFSDVNSLIPGSVISTNIHVKENQMTAIAYHFVLHIIGVEPEFKFITLTIEPLRLNLLPEPSKFNFGKMIYLKLPRNLRS